MNPQLHPQDGNPTGISQFLTPEQREIYDSMAPAGLAQIGKASAPSHLPPLIGRIREDGILEIQEGADFRTHDRIEIKVGKVTLHALYLRMEHAAEHGAAFEDAPPNHDVIMFFPIYTPRTK